MTLCQGPRVISFPFPIELDCDEGEGPLCVYLLDSARLDYRAAFHPALDDGSNAVDWASARSTAGCSWGGMASPTKG